MQETAKEYAQRITGYVEGKEPLKIQQKTCEKLQRLTKGLDRKKLTKRPQPDKWSIAEILAHLADTELVAGWRLRLILGSNGTPVQGFDQDVWAKTFDYAKQDPKLSLEVFRVLRENNLRLLKSVPNDLWQNYGMHSERGKETVAHIVNMYAGHDLNHLQQIEAILQRGAAKR
jgi:hypothetical protein